MYRFFGHLGGIPVEELAAAALLTAVALLAGARLAGQRLLHRLDHRKDH